MTNAADTAEFDAFGDRLPPMRARGATARARTVAVAVFWSLALLLVAGRVIYTPVLDPVTGVLQLASR